MSGRTISLERVVRWMWNQIETWMYGLRACDDTSFFKMIPLYWNIFFCKQKVCVERGNLKLWCCQRVYKPTTAASRLFPYLRLCCTSYGPDTLVWVNAWCGYKLSQFTFIRRPGNAAIIRCCNNCSLGGRIECNYILMWVILLNSENKLIFIAFSKL